MTVPVLTCEIAECKLPHYARGWCNKHWQRWRKYGDPRAVKTRLPFRSPEDLLAQTVLTQAGCREWRGRNGWLPAVGSSDSKRYGKLKIGERNFLVHRLMWLLTHPDEEQPTVVRHLCNNPPCCEPTHLAGGTQRDNIQHCMQSGRYVAGGSHVLGVRHSNAKLTDDDVYEIRRLAASGEGQYVLAAEFGICQNNVSRIVRGLAWRHLLEEGAS